MYRTCARGSLHVYSRIVHVYQVSMYDVAYIHYYIHICVYRYTRVWCGKYGVGRGGSRRADVCDNAFHAYLKTPLHTACVVIRVLYV